MAILSKAKGWLAQTPGRGEAWSGEEKTRNAHTDRSDVESLGDLYEMSSIAFTGPDAWSGRQYITFVR
jgi:hypothetical protein